MADEIIPPVANEYDEAARALADNRKGDLRSSFVAAAAAGVAPDQQARVLDLSRRHNLPANVVARNLDKLERQESEAPPDFNLVADRAPGLTRWLSDPANAALSHDDLEPLARLERGARVIIERDPEPKDAGFALQIGRAAASGFTDLQASAWHLAAIYGTADPAEAAERVAQASARSAELRAKAPDYAREFGQAMTAEGGDINRAWRRFTGSYAAAKDGRILDALRDYHAGGLQTIGQALDMISAAVIRPRGLLYSTAENLAFGAPSLLLSAAGGAAGGLAGPLGVPAGMAAGAFTGAVPVEIGAWITQAMQKRGVDMTNPQAVAAAYADAAFMREARGEAERKGLTTAAVDAIFSAFAGRAVAGAKGAGRLARAGVAAAEIGVQAAGETLSEAAGQAAAKKTVAGIDVGDAILEGIVSLGHSAGEVAAGAAVRGGFHVKTAVAAQQVADKTGQALAAQRAAQALQEAGQAVEASKTAKRLPDAIRQVVAAAAEGQEASTVYFQTEAWDAYWQGKGLSPAKAAAEIMGDGGQAYTEAKAQGHQLEIELADYIGKVAPTEHYAGLLPETRVRPDGMSLTEATEFLKGLPSLMDELATEAVGPGRMATPEEAARAESGAKVRQAIVDMLIAAQTPRTEAERLGQLWEKHLVARAERLGADPMTLFEQMGLSVERIADQAPAEPAAIPEGTAIESAAGDVSFPFGENAPPAPLGPEVIDILRDEEALRSREILAEQGGLTPVLDAIRANGGISIKKLEKMGRRSELIDLHWTQIFTTNGKSLDSMAEALAQEGEGALKERDVNLLIDKIKEEAAAIQAYKTKHGDKAYQLLRRMLQQEGVSGPGAPSGEGPRLPGEGGAAGRPSEVSGPAGERTRPGLPEGPAPSSEPLDLSIHPEIADVKAQADDWLAREAAARGMTPDERFRLQFATHVHDRVNELMAQMGRELRALPKEQQQAFLDNYENHPLQKEAKDTAAKFQSLKAAYPDIVAKVSRDAETNKKIMAGFNPIQRTLEQGAAGAAPRFYSKLQRTIEQKLGASATIDQVRATLKEVKGEEMKWSGLEEYLSARKGTEKVSKNDLLAFLHGNQLQIEEKVLGGGGVPITQGLQDREIDVQRLTPDQQEALKTLRSAGLEPVVPPTDMTSEVHFMTDDGEIWDRRELADEIPKLTTLPFEVRRMTAAEAAQYKDDPAYGDVAEGSWGVETPGDVILPVAESTVPEATAKEMARDQLAGIGELEYNGVRIDEIFDAADQFGPKGGEARFEKYALPGGANYREVLFTLPETKPVLPKPLEGFTLKVTRENEATGQRDVDVFDPSGTYVGSRTGTRATDAEILADWGQSEAVRAAKEAAAATTFRSPHFQEPNVLAHTRLTDRTDSRGKRVLFVEEIQSDWHQKGRREGYALTPPEISALQEELFKLAATEKALDFTNWTKEKEAEHSALKDRRDEIYDKLRGKGIVPDAPFKKSWHEFVLKRLIRMAAEESYDSIAWTTGEQQAERYDLSKQVDHIDYRKHGRDRYEIAIVDKNGDQVHLPKEDFNAVELEDVVGKEIAQRIVNGEGTGARGRPHRTLENVDLKIGGEGMKGFYDKIVPQFLEKFTKKYGAKVGETEIRLTGEVEDPSDPHGMPITADNVPVNVHALDLTPELRASALEQGFELFQAAPGEGARGRVRFGPDSGNPKFTIDLLQKADRSTFLHESGHVFLETLRTDAAAIAAIPAEQQTPAQRQLLKDWDTATAWLGVEGSYKEQGRISTAQHEQWARGFEAYLLEGKAPSASLRAAFRRFKAWLIKLYGEITSLKVELTPEVRGVFDRLVATQQEIIEAQADMERAPLFADPAAAGLDSKAMEGYMAAVEEARAAAEEDLAAKVLERVRREEQAWWKEERASVRVDIAKDLAQRPEQIALAALQSERFPDGTEYAEGTLPPKLDRSSIPRDVLERLPKGVTTAEGGAHPDILAGIFGFDTGGELLLALENTIPFKDLVEQTTDEIMTARHGDVLRDVEALQDEAMKAIHTEKHAEVLRAELAHLVSDNFAAFKGLAKKITGRVPSIEAARIEAAKAIGRRKVRELRPGLFKVAEAKAAREARDAFLAGDIQAAFDFKRRQLANHELYRAASQAKEQIDRSLDAFKRLARKDEKLAKRRDIDLINAARAILSKFGLDRTEKPASEYLEQLRNFDPEMYETVNEIVTAATERAASWRELSVDDFSAMADTVDSLWDLSLRTQQIRIEGKVIDKQEAIDALTKRLADIGLPAERAGYKRALTSWDKAQIYLLGARAALRRVEAWAQAIGPEAIKFIWNPISEATAAYRVDKRSVLQKYLELIKGLAGTLHRGEIAAPEIGYTFRDKAELLHALLHTGNESNLTKLLRGRGWGEHDATGELDTSRWRAFEQRMQAEGVFTKKDYDFAQGVWDLLETLKAPAQKAHKEMYGYYFGEVAAREVVTPYGTYRGGYVPAIVDSFIVREADIRAEREALEKSNNSYMFPTAGRGFTKKRVEAYAKPLLLDLGLVASHIDKVLRFVHIEPRVKDVGRIVMDRTFRGTLDAFDPAVGGDMLVPWLQRAAQQKIETPSRGLAGRALDTFFRELRRRTGLQIMAVNVVNTIQQFTGISIGAVKVAPKHLRNALWTYARAPKETAAAIAARSPFMDTRVTTQVFEIQNQLEELLLDPSKFEEARAFAQKHGYILQAGAQNIVDNVVWTGAYEQATERGAPEPEAVREADAAVRQTQGSFNPEDVSRFETGSPFVRAFTMFYSYFNMQANLLGSEFSDIQRQGGLKKGAGRALYVYTMGFMIPAVLSELIARALSGRFDEDDDDSYLDDFLAAFFFGQFRTATAMFPIVGPTVQAGINAWNAKWYDDKITTSPAVAMIESAVQAPRSVYKAIADEGSKKKAARDTLTLLGLLTGLPLAPAARPLGYLADISEGKARPTGPFDFARGLLTGRSGARR